MQYQADAMGGSTSELASPGTRLVAWLIDIVIYIVVAIAGALVGAITGDVLGEFIILAVLAVLVLFIIQMALLATRAQTIGKIVMQIHIVDHVTGGHPGWARLILLRTLVNALISSVFPVIYFLVDSLFVFRADHRTIHDMIAGTQVDRIAD